MFLSGNNYQLQRRAVVWSEWPFFKIKLNQHTAQCVGSCYLIFARMRVARSGSTPHTPNIYIINIYCGVGVVWGQTVG